MLRKLRLPASLILSCLALPVQAQSSQSCTGTGYIDPNRKISDDFVALREAPNVQSAMLARMTYGTRFLVCGASGAWTLLRLGNGQQGFAASRLITVEVWPTREVPNVHGLRVQEDQANEDQSKSSDAAKTAVAIGIGVIATYALGRMIFGSSSSSADYGSRQDGSSSGTQRKEYEYIPRSQPAEREAGGSGWPGGYEPNAGSGVHGYGGGGVPPE